MTALYFGEPWDAPAVDDATWVPTPSGQRCALCGEEVVSGDRGWIRGTAHYTPGGVLAAADAVVHAECELDGTLGHVIGVCSCTGHEPGRQRARLVWERAMGAREASRG